MIVASAQKQWVDRQAIADLLPRYCRGIDRCDLELMQSVFWADARARYGIYDGEAIAFAKLTINTVREGCHATMHFLGNSAIEVTGDHGVGETYVMAYHSLSSMSRVSTLLEDPAFAAAKDVEKLVDGPCSFVVGSRYLDRFRRSGSEWRIQERSYVWDWCERGPANLLSQGSSASRLLIGRRDSSDPSYALFASIDVQ
jgi:SnoaL-like domain